MADVTVTIPVGTLSFKAWLNSSYIANSIKDGEGKSLINELELGPDQEDIFDDMLDQASREVLKIFTSRQGDVNGTPFEKTDTDIIYRFNEATPVLKQATSIKSVLEEDVKNAIYTYVALLWYQKKGNGDQIAFLMEQYQYITKNIELSLYKLHD